MGMTGEHFPSPRISQSELALYGLQKQVLNSFYQMHLQGIMVVVFIILYKVFVLMNTNN